MANPVLTVAEQIALANDMARSGGPLTALTQHLSSSNIVPTKNTKLSDLTECIFTGYQANPGMSPGPAYQGIDGLVHLGYPEVTFIGTDGAAQSMMSVATGPITMAGTITAIVTSAGMAGSPVTLTITVATTDTDQDIAQKIATAIRANVAVNAQFSVVVNGGGVFYMTRTAAAAQDATMNVALANGTALGLTARPTATQLRAGSAPGGLFVADTAYLQYATDDANTVLRWAQQITPVNFGAVGQGAELALDYVYGA